MKEILNNAIRIGITIPLVCGILLYLSGIVYRLALLSTWGFPAYTGDMNLNELLLPARSVSSYIFGTIVFILLIIWMNTFVKKLLKWDTERFKKISDLITKAKKIGLTPEIEEELKNEFAKKDKHDIREERTFRELVYDGPKWESFVVLILFLIFAIVSSYQRGVSTWIPGLAVLSSSLLILKSTRIKIFPKYFIPIGLFVLGTLYFSFWAGGFDANKYVPIPVKIQMEGATQTGFYYYEDSRMVYIVAKGQHLKISKDKIIYMEK